MAIPIKANYSLGLATSFAEFTPTDAVPINNGGTGAISQQAALNALTNAVNYSAGYVLTRDSSGNAVFAPSGGNSGGPWQPYLISGSNIKTVNGTSLLGSGDIVITGGGAISNIQLTQAGTTGSVTLVSDAEDGYPRYAYNWIKNTGDGAIAWNGTQGKVHSLFIEHQVNSAGAKGGRDVVQINLNVTTPSGTYAGSDKNYVALTCLARSTCVDNAAGLFGFNPYAILAAGGSCMNLSGMEINVTARATAAAAPLYKSGIQIASLADDALQGSLYDAAIAISSQGGVGWKRGILFGAMNGAYPTTATSALIGTVGPIPAAVGIDFTSASFAGGCALGLRKGSTAIMYADNVSGTPSNTVIVMDMDVNGAFVLGRNLLAGQLNINVDGTVQQMTAGGANTGGVGFRMLRIPN